MLTVTSHLDIVTKLSGLAIDLYPVMQELLKCGSIENTVVRGPREVDSEFMFCCGGLPGCCFRLQRKQYSEPTEKGTQQSATMHQH